jgi:hypothetical protein
VPYGRKSVNTLERMWKEAVKNYVKIATQHLSGGGGGAANPNKPQDSHNTNTEPMDL